MTTESIVVDVEMTQDDHDVEKRVDELMKMYLAVSGAHIDFIHSVSISKKGNAVIRHEYPNGVDGDRYSILIFKNKDELIRQMRCEIEFHLAYRWDEDSGFEGKVLHRFVFDRTRLLVIECENGDIDQQDKVEYFFADEVMQWRVAK